MSASGSWSVTTDSPMGKQTMELELSQAGAALTGTAATTDETVEITDGAADGLNLTWKIPLTKPMKMGLVFTVMLDGDAFKGSVKAGLFPAMKVEATRH